ncbi:MAG: glycosyltransferase [Alphaproteobacteria bacterium]|nr:glycosyltransferase [Alphaproteobacteria bacterium]
MKVLFAHRFYPGQYGRLAAALAARGDRCVFLHAEGEGAPAPGIEIRRYMPARAARAETHHYLQGMETAVLHGQAAYRAARELAQSGFRPDVICAHAGFGPGLYLGEAFRGVPTLGYFEWFYRARGGDADFHDPADVSPDDALRIPTRNAQLLLELETCARGLTPTAFQHAQFPDAYRPKLEILHDGVDTDALQPLAGTIAELGIAGLPDDAEVVSYATRGLESYRGFPAFMSAIAELAARRPKLHALVLGEDRTFYGRPPPDGRGWKEIMLERLPGLDRGRVHFLGTLPWEGYRRVLQTTQAHVYLTVPFVLSWSLIEAMACGAPIVGSDTAPVREVIADGESGLLADFHAPSAIAERIGALLDDRAMAARLGTAARATAIERYAARDLLPRHIALIEAVARDGQGRMATPKRTRSRSAVSLQSAPRLNRVR